MMELDDYELCYTSSNGNEVWVHKLHTGPERNDNEAIARFLADAGETVKLSPIGSEPGVKNPDAEIGGMRWEFKTNRVGTTNSVDNEIRRAHRQANYILLWVVVPIDLISLENVIYNRVRKCENLIVCRFIVGNKLYEFTRAEIISQQFRGRFEKGEGGPA